jgi:hypothetical protein
MRFLISNFLFGEFLHLGDGKKKVSATHKKSFFGKKEIATIGGFFWFEITIFLKIDFSMLQNCRQDS